MQVPKESAAALREQIEEAFRDSVYPGHSNIVYDLRYADCREVAEAFKAKHWKDVPLEVLLHYHESLSFFSDEAFRFYLPAYLLIAVERYGEADVIPLYVLFSLQPPPTGEERDRFLRRMEGFTRAQREAIKSFLRFMRDEHAADFPTSDLTRDEPSALLDRFWEAF